MKVDGMKKGRGIVRIVLAALAGAANGFFGAGGGMLVVPCLQFACGTETRRSHATAIAVVLPLSVISSVIYLLRGAGDTTHLFSIAIGVTVGGALGALLLRKVPKGLLTILFYGVMIYAGARFVL